MGSAMAAVRIEAEAARIGFLKVHGHNGISHKYAWSIRCSGCREEFRAYWPLSIPPQQMLKNMRLRGWDVGMGERPLCKVCAHPAADKTPKPKPEGQSFEPFLAKAPKRMMYAALANFADTLPPPEPKPLSPSVALLARGGYIAETEGLVQRMEKAAARKVEAVEKLAKAREKLSRVQAERIALRAAERAARKEQHRQEREDRNPPAPVHVVYQATIPKVAIKETAPMSNPNPSPKISFVIYGLLDSLIDKQKRLYMPGYNDARLAKEAGTTEEIVAYLRKETFGELARDPRAANLKDDIEMMKLELVDMVKAFHVKLGELASRVDQYEAQARR